ncbi:MAG: glycosyltransferase [Chloroflexus sp.]|nr:glycosyltransferase [Chloroflexus sp.]
MTIPIIIPLFEGADYIRNCLRSLQQQDGAYSVIVVCNGQDDSAIDIVQHEFPAVALLNYPRPLGFAGAVNAGLQFALDVPNRPEFVITLNQDTEVDPGWLSAVVASFTDPAIGIVGCLARFSDGRIQHAGGTLQEPLWYGRNRSALDDPDPIRYMAGLALGMRVAMLDQIGWFDEAFYPAYFEDVDLCLRAVRHGWRMALAESATLVHHEGALRHHTARHAQIIERNRWRLLLKHRSVAELLEIVLPAERLHLQAQAEQGISDRLRQAYLQALLMLPTIARQRNWSRADVGAIRSELLALRAESIARERITRIAGLQQALQTHVLPAMSRSVSETRLQTLPDEPSSAPNLAEPVLIDEDSHQETVSIQTTQTIQEDAPCTRRSAFVPGIRPPVAIIVLTWNGLAVTQRCFESLRAKTRDVPYRLIVVDNGSTDGTVEWLRTQRDVTLIANSENRGFAAGVNQGIAAAPPDHDILLLNNDTEIIEETWLSHLRAVANDHPDYGIVGCLLLFPNGLLQHAGTYMPKHNFWGYQIGGGEPYIGQYPGIREVEGVTGACMYIRRDVIATIGGMDEAYFSYYEDTDYCLRATRAGFKIACTGGARVVHHENSSARLNNVDWWRLFSHGQRVFLSKWRDYYYRQYHHGLVWHSLISHSTGYATSSREFVRELDRRGYDIRLACIFGTDYTEPLTRDPRLDQLRNRPKDTSLPQVVYSQADAFIKNSGRYRVGFTMLESDLLPADWTYQSNQMDEIWVPTHFTREVFIQSGVRRPIHVIPLGFNPNYFHPQIQAYKPANTFVFLSVFEWIERKAPEILVRAYVNEFKRSEDVVLVLKVFNHDPQFNVHHHIHEIVQRPDAPRIVVLLNQEIPEHQMGGLYRSADCFVLPTRGEGWGMPILEAMACGLPVIATDWGAQREFFNEQLGFPIRVRKLVPAVARSPYYAGSRWAEADIDHLRYLMRYVYEHRTEAQAIGMRAAAEVHQRWTWERAVDRMCERLKEIMC